MVTIGITYTGTDVKHQFYLDWLNSSGEELNIIPFSEKEKNIERINECDGLLLSGGMDIDPSLYGASPDYHNAPDEFDQARDNFEMSLYQLALEIKIPVLGICRGFQLINCAEGGTLHRDLGPALNETHWAENKPSYKTHKVIIEKNTLLYGIALSDSGFVSTSHHQAVDRTGNNLLVNSRAEDGTIEGLEWKDKNNLPFMLAVQWHPELMFRTELEGTPLAKNIRDRFIKEVKQFKTTKQ